MFIQSAVKPIAEKVDLFLLKRMPGGQVAAQEKNTQNWHWTRQHIVALPGILLQAVRSTSRSVKHKGPPSPVPNGQLN